MVVEVAVVVVAVAVVVMFVVESDKGQTQYAVDRDARFRYYRCISRQEVGRESVIVRRVIERGRVVAAGLDNRFFGLKSLCSERVATHCRHGRVGGSEQLSSRQRTAENLGGKTVIRKRVTVLRNTKYQIKLSGRGLLRGRDMAFPVRWWI